MKSIPVLLAVALAISFTACAQSPGPAPASPAALSASDLGAFVDGMLPVQMAREGIAGAVVLVVKDGGVLFSKGYGWSDVAKRTPVSPDATLFRPGSISKLFTWTAVMQLVEEGKLDLDRDVNDYLDFRIPPAFGKPLTMRQLMTHTPGFEETYRGLFAARGESLEGLGDYLKAHRPAQIFAPGTVPAYSNYGAALAGYVVERVSAEPFAEYAERHIFEPLGMRHTTFYEPLPQSLASLMSKGYVLASQSPQPFETIQAPPGGASATAADIGRFMIAHLQDGSYGTAAVLEPGTAREMHARQTQLAPQMNGMCLGFYEESRNGHRIIGHGGDTTLFHSNLHLILDAGVGFFISLNSAGRGQLDVQGALWQAFLDRYFPWQPSTTAAIASAETDLRAVVGSYIPSRRPETSILKVGSLLSQVRISANRDGTLSANVSRDVGGQLRRYREVAPMLFREVDGQDQVAFVKDASGDWTLVPSAPFQVYQKAPWYEEARLNTSIIIGTLVILVLTLLFWPIAAAVRRHYGRRLSLRRPQRIRRVIVRLSALMQVAFLAAFGMTFVIVSRDMGLMGARFDGWVRFVQAVGWTGMAGTLVLAANAVMAGIEKGRRFWGRLADTLIALAGAGFVYFVLTWNLLAPSLVY